MESDRLLVWLALVPDGGEAIRSGMLCRRHADAMVVPRGWTLDDRRESTPRLFRVTEPAGNNPASTNHPSRGRKKPAPAPLLKDEPPMQFAFEQPAQAGLVEIPETPETPEMPVPAGVTVADVAPTAENADPDETKALPWRPIFDDTDDLGGLLKANSPLLSRAFRGRDASPPNPSGPAAG